MELKLNWYLVTDENIEPTPIHKISGWGVGEWRADLNDEEIVAVRIYQIRGDQVGDEWGKWYWLAATEGYMSMEGKYWGSYSGGFDTENSAKENFEKWWFGERKVKDSDHRLSWGVT